MTNDALLTSKTRNCENCQTRGDSIFCDLPPEALNIINSSKIVNHYRRGQVVFYAGNFPTGLYCVATGLIKLESSGTGTSNNGHILRVIQGGEILGYRALFANQNYEASAIVQDDATICMIPKAAVMELLEKFPKVAMKLLAHVSRELKAAEARLCGQTDKNASGRIAEALLFLKGKLEEQVWTRKEIAEWAGTTPETVMRCLAEFESEGMIEQKGRKIKIKDRAALMACANIPS